MGLIKRAKPEPVAEPPAQRAAAEWLADLRAESPASRRAAARELAGVPGVTAELVERFGEESDRAVREVIGTSLVTGADAAAAALVGPLLRADDAMLRNDARDLLELLPGGEHVALGLIADPDSSVRMFASDVLATRLGEAAAAPLSALLEHERDINVCAHVAEKLARVGSLAHIDSLRACLERFAGDPFLGFAIEEATSSILTRTSGGASA